MDFLHLFMLIGESHTDLAAIRSLIGGRSGMFRVQRAPVHLTTRQRMTVVWLISGCRGGQVWHRPQGVLS